MRTPDKFIIVTDGLTTRPRFSRRYAVIAERYLHLLDESSGIDWNNIAALQTDSPRRAQEYRDELNRA